MRSVLLGLVFAVGMSAQAPVAPVAVERDGLLAVEAELFTRQTKADVRRWYLTSEHSTPPGQGDPDEPHWKSASGGAYVEVLPDTRTNHDERLIHNENFVNVPGVMAVLEYDVEFTTPGRYYVWVSAYSTGTEDNGVHVGLDGEWPESGQRMQWCEGKNSWAWASKQRTEQVHCGEPGLIYLDVENAGRHTVMFSMREDGFEMDRWLMTSDPKYKP